MNKKELIKIASETSGVSQQTLHACLEILLNTMSTELTNGKSLTFSNFGTFKAKVQKERFVRNPKNGEISLVKSKIKISFRISPGIYRKDRK